MVNLIYTIMKLKQSNPSWGFSILLFFALLEFTSLRVLATNESRDLLWSGNWISYGRSVIQMPISASICNSIIFIQNSVPDRNMTIRIQNEQGTVVYEQGISKSEAACVCINVDDLVEGEYVLELSSPFGDLLQGKFVCQ